MQLDRRKIVVTGGASGMGRSTAMKAATAGAKVYIGDVNEKGGVDVVGAIESAGGTARFIKLDLSDNASVDAFAEAVHADAGGPVDALINTAGWDVIENFLDNDPSMWDRIIAINLSGGIRLTQKIAAEMVEVRKGKIVNVASDAGRVGSSGEAVYSAAKGGMIAFTKSLARELARYQINVNVVCPGPTDTPLFNQQSDEKRKEALVRAIPFRRLGKPEEMADAILFFVGDESSYITGQTLSVSGGLTMAG